MNNDKKLTIILSLGLSVLIVTTITTVVLISSGNASKAKIVKEVDLELQEQAEKIKKEGNIYYDLEEKAPISEKEIVVEENAKKEMEEENNNKVVTEIVEKKLNFSLPLSKDSYEILDKFDEKYIGLNQVYIETIIFKVSFKTGNPGIIYRVKKDNTPVYSMESGKVISVGDNTAKNAGYSIIIEHSNGIKSEYYCLKKVDVTSGMDIKKGQKIAEVGDLGNTLLRNELRVYVLEGDKIVDPNKYIGKGNI